MGKNDAAVALKVAAEMLVSAMRLRNFSGPAIHEAFKLLNHSNPQLVQWVAHDLADIIKEN